MTDDELLEQFERCTLANTAFHHEEHIRVAFLYLRRYPAWEALGRMSSSLVNFAATQGQPSLYNETITWAFVLLIRERMARAGGPQGWAEFAAQNTDLFDWSCNILEKYYRKETLASELAKNTFLFPDRLPARGEQTEGATLMPGQEERNGRRSI